MSDLFSSKPPARAPEPRTNVPELSVSELAFSLKKTLEDTYARVRVRGELSKVKIHTSGHMYSDLKDNDACLAVVCWKTSVAKLSVRPEEGLEVICTGRISTYPQRSNYQLIIESMELAGAGALLKMLEDRKKRLAAEGLFDPARKKKLPFLPLVIGVVTSPTGAVIRDIIHRLEDRFPRHVLVWPVPVQGPGAADQIAAAINGFDALQEGGRIPRPDLLIVARGGGSLEDLMPFNEENVVRAASQCRIPIISAVGHETDTTLIDYVSDIRAPTPTAAAEMAVPVRAQLLALIEDDASRMRACMTRLVDVRRERLASLGIRLGDPTRLLELKTQRFDHTIHRLGATFAKSLHNGEARLIRVSGRLLHPQAAMRQKAIQLDKQAHRLADMTSRLIDKRLHGLTAIAARVQKPQGVLQDRQRQLVQWSERLNRFSDPDIFLKNRAVELGQASRMLESLSFKSVLQRGYAVVRDTTGRLIPDGAATNPDQRVRLEFRDKTVDAVID